MGRQMILYGSKDQIKYFDILLEDLAYPDLNKKQWCGFETKVLEYFALNPDVNHLTKEQFSEILDNELSSED